MVEASIDTEIYNLIQEVRNLQTTSDICRYIRNLRDFIDSNSAFIQVYQDMVNKGNNLLQSCNDKFQKITSKYEEHTLQTKVCNIIATAYISEILYLPEIVDFIPSPEAYLNETYPGIISMYDVFNSAICYEDYKTYKFDGFELLAGYIDFYIIDNILKDEYIPVPTGAASMQYIGDENKYFRRWHQDADCPFLNCYIKSAMVGVLENLKKWNNAVINETIKQELDNSNYDIKDNGNNRCSTVKKEQDLSSNLAQKPSIHYYSTTNNQRISIDNQIVDISRCTTVCTLLDDILKSKVIKVNSNFNSAISKFNKNKMNGLKFLHSKNGIYEINEDLLKDFNHS